MRSFEAWKAVETGDVAREVDKQRDELLKAFGVQLGKMVRMVVVEMKGLEGGNGTWRKR